MSIILLTFANSATQPLATLSEEDREVNKLLSQMAAQEEGWQVVHNSHAKVRDIVDDIIVYQDALSVFLFSGHAERDKLITEGAEANADGIAALLGQCPNLKLVVLNGCSTQGQVEALLDAGVPCVIATSSPVEDTKATQFSIAFFRAMAERNKNIAKAFTEGINVAKTFGQISSEINRGVVLRNKSKDEPTWGVFYQEGHEINLEWQLSPEIIDTTFTPNELLLKEIWEAIAPFVNKENKKVTQVEIRDRIITELPHPISEYLRKLIAKERQGGEQEVFYNKLNHDRLLYLLYTYTICVELLAYTLLAQIWDELLMGFDNQKVPVNLKEKIKAFFDLRLRERKVYNIIPLIQDMGDFMKDNNIQPFIEEYNHIRHVFSAHTEFYEACMTIEKIRSETIANDRLPDSESRPLCIQVEKDLACIMAEVGFLVKYKMASMKDIHLIKLKHESQPKYKLNFVELKYRASGMDIESKEALHLMDNSSVVILNETEGKIKYLNLSPFIFDENSYDDRAKLASLCVFQSYEKTASALTFRYIYKPAERPLVVRNKGTEYYYTVADQINTFYRYLFQKDLIIYERPEN